MIFNQRIVVNKIPLIEKGFLLVATPNMTDPLYKQSVVLICEYTSYGSFGLILNKPYELSSQESPSEINEITLMKDSLRIGGAMQQNQLMLLHASTKHRDQTLRVTEGVYLGGDFPFLQELIKDEPDSGLLICFGYTGWTAGELENQFKEGLWYLYPATKNLIFDVPPEKLWKETLSTMGGKYKNISLIPSDLNLN